MNAIVKNNILFGKRFDADFYERTVRTYALLENFDALPYRDNTILGEKGVSLSGRREVRLALARALYTRADRWPSTTRSVQWTSMSGRHVLDNVPGAA
ncbi:hypothetical protein V1508DRAFT_399342 [Lipomyces doorenjongii]|uniref:uncharacterized protein n=1 Tax=Lipomyces doorenjongii TaxID=383834 RepID=UPI0034CE6E80